MALQMDPPKDLLNAQTHIWTHIFSFLNSMALRCAIELGIPDAIQNHGAPMTLPTLATSLSIPPNKAPSLHRLMRLLLNSNFFSKQTLPNGEEAFELTINSRLLLKDHPLSIAPFARFILDPISIQPSYYFSKWFQNGDETPFHVAHNKSLWEFASNLPDLDRIFNEGMASDSRFVGKLLLDNSEFRGMIEGLDSIVDVGGGDGTMSKAIVEVFPELKCVVFDQPHVVNGVKECGRNLQFVGGDMFECVPKAQAVLLKWILHDWSDEHCIKILQRCNEAIPRRQEGGKIIIIDIVVETKNHSQFLFDIEMLNLTIGGKERTEEQWNKLFINSGFKDYKIFPILGPRSVIEVYPS